MGTTLLIAKEDEVAVAGAVDASCGWDALENLVATAGSLSKTVNADVLAYVEQGYHSFKLYAPRMLATLDITEASVAQPLLAAADVIRDRQDIPSRSAPFLQPRSKWRGYLRDPETNRDRLWGVAVLFHLREAFSSGDVWLTHSRRYSDMKLTFPLKPTTSFLHLSCHHHTFYRPHMLIDLPYQIIILTLTYYNFQLTH